MALQKLENKTLTLATSSDRQTTAPVRQNVLDEDEYTEQVQQIIVRDFYPDLPKLQAQADYLDALKSNDIQKLREIHIKYGPKRGSAKTPSIYDTPATFETPDIDSKRTDKTETATSNASGGEKSGDKDKDPESSTNPEPQPEKKKAATIKLDKFLANNTSEDNASFEEILCEADKQHRIKHDWLYEQEKEKYEDSEQQLALPGADKQALWAIEGAPLELKTWKYKPRNELMYVPDGVDLSMDQKIKMAGSSREIVHTNTRFKVTPFDNSRNRRQLQEAATEQAKTLQGRIGADGKEILPTVTPKVNGYGFVATPSPAPGVAESPLMTWGEIEGTPFRLDGSDTPLTGVTPGPTFKIPDVPKRDRIGLELAEKASKAHRMKKQEALKRVTANLSSPSPKFGAASKSDRLMNLSPAAQRLASAKLGVRTNTDKALRASYTPSPSRLPGDKTPYSLTPGSLRNTPGSSHSGVHTPGNTPKRDSSQVSSLTDNLLNLPKRSKAKDYF